MKFHCQKVETTRNGKLRRLSGRFQTLIWRPGETVQNLVSPRLSGRVIDSPAINNVINSPADHVWLDIGQKLRYYLYHIAVSV